MDIVGKQKVEKIEGRNVTVYPPDSARLMEVSTTWTPTFEGAGVTHILKKENPVETDQVEYKELNERMEKTLNAFDDWKDEMRKSIVAPAVIGERRHPTLHDWAQVALSMMRGKAVSDSMLHELALDDVITPDNPGLVPDALVRDFDDLVDAGRPFINSLRQIAAPSTGMNLIVPSIVARAGTGTQSAEKADITGTTAPKVGTITFPYSQVFGGADVALQMLNRGDAAFYDLLIQLLAEAYSLDAEGKAIDALLTPTGTLSAGGTQDGPEDGGVLDPEDPHFGAAWQNSIEVYRRAPDTIWMNAAAVAAFIDAKNPTTNGPLYSNLAADFTAGNGAGGRLSGMRPIYVPAMDEAEVDVIVGPSRAYVYAEDPARTLQVDVPSKAGRDIALVGGFFFGPRAAAAFTTYTVASS
jgi:HK97 family phage major capsid protein